MYVIIKNTYYHYRKGYANCNFDYAILCYLVMVGF